ncbi:MAG: NADPH-dependent FMN reductase [Hyphomicrobiaceae bacterium]
MPVPEPSTIKLAFLSGSVRRDSLNLKLARLACQIAAERGHDATYIDLAAYPMPIYDGDLETAEGVPENARRLFDDLARFDGVFIASPEYNGGMAPLLKNTIDWLSRIKTDALGPGMLFRTRVFALGSAAASEMGGVRGLIQLRQTLAVALGATVIGGQVQVAGGPENFDAEGNLTDARRRGFLEANIETLARVAGALKP